MNYPANLADLTQLDRDAIEDDKQRWLKAYKMVRELAMWQIKDYIASLDCEIEQNDMRNRLNICWKNLNQPR
jgi:hypothetical protein